MASREKLISSWCLSLGISVVLIGLLVEGIPLLEDGEFVVGQPIHTNLWEMTPFGRELDQLRMNSLFAKSQDAGDMQSSARNRRLVAPSCQDLCKQCIEIDVFFHLAGYRLGGSNISTPWMIPHPTDEFRLLREEIKNSTTEGKALPEILPGRFSSVEDICRLIQANIDLLNNLYVDTPFRFRWVNDDPGQAEVGIQNNWAFFYAANIHKRNEFAAAFHQGNARTLNVYLVYRICGHPFIWLDKNCDTIGAGTNPSYQLDGSADGIYLSYDTLTGGGLKYYSNGISLVHEVGHWLGLLHVFQSETSAGEGSQDAKDVDVCDPINAVNGDFVDDTPYIPQPSVKMYRCSRTYYEAQGEETPNSCPNLPGVDPVFNIMNYIGDEDCYNDGHALFTCGQVERMYKQWLLYRDHTTDCAFNEMKLHLAMKLESNAVHAEIASFDSNKPVFNLMRDMDLTLFPQHATNDTRTISFCVPQGDYILGVTEQGRGGFPDGFIELSVNGALVHRVDGNFGSTECVKFNVNGPTAELRNSVETIGTDFGERYQYDATGKDTTVTCSASPELFYREPVPIQKGRFMRVVVALTNATKGMCINSVPKIDMEISDITTTVFPSDDATASFFASRVLECGGEECVVAFDLSLLEGIYNPKNRNGLYNTTCRATVKVGFGSACDEYLKQGGIDCSPESQSEVYSTAEGQIIYSLPATSAAARATHFVVGLLAAVGALLFVW